MTTLVLVHGAWAAPGMWNEVVSLISDRAECRLADLPTCNRATASYADDVDHVRELVRAAGPDVVLVGISYGCAVVSSVSEPNVQHQVYIAGPMLDEGENLYAIATAEMTEAEAAEPDLTFNEDGTTELILDPEEDRLVYSEAAVTRIYDHEFRPWVIAAALETIDEPAWRTVPTTYVVATRDTTIPTSEQRRMASRAKTVIEVDTPHMVHCEIPEELAEIIVAATQPS